jgi:fatty-acyl-CoA synthase
VVNGSGFRRVIGELPGAVESVVGSAVDSAVEFWVRPVAGRLPGVEQVAGGLPGSHAIRDAVTAVKVLVETGVARPVRPDRLLGMGLSLARYGVTPAAGWAAAAAARPDAIALVDDLGPLTFQELNRLSSTIALGLRDSGLGESDVVGVLLRNSRWLPLTLSALAKVGADAVLLNTGFGGPQLADVLRREGARALIYDEEFTNLLDDAVETVPDLIRIVGWQDSDEEPHPTLATLAATPRRYLPRPVHRSRQVILTSGTTGAPKGASRSLDGIEPAAAFLAGIPLRARETTVIACPLFHTWGLAHLGMSLLLQSTVVLSRKFDPEATLRLVADQHATALVAVPVMLQRMLELDEELRRGYDTSSLRIVAVSGSSLPGELSSSFMDAFGEVLYNLYGSTEVAYATVAGPADLRAAPGTAGRPVMGTTLRLLDPDGNEVPTGEVGRIFVGNPMLFDGYTGGGDKDRIDGLVSSGDLGRFDEAGRLFVEGRDDDMIVSGGENVFPAEVEDLLTAHPDIVEAAVLGVDDAKMGQRLKAFVVTSGTLSERAVKDHVKRHLASYKVPREVVFLDELPRNATGKVLKRELADIT